MPVWLQRNGTTYFGEPIQKDGQELPENCTIDSTWFSLYERPHSWACGGGDHHAAPMPAALCELPQVRCAAKHNRL